MSEKKGKKNTKKKITEQTKAEPAVHDNQAKEQLPEKKSNLTPQVMRLVEKKQGINPVVSAGKSVIPPKLRGKQPLSKVIRRQLEETETVIPEQEETEVVNLTELVIRHEAPEILDRFNACSCEKCVEIFSRMVAPKIPVRYARVRKIGGSLNTGSLIERSESVRRQVVDVMTRELVGTKNRCFHDIQESENE